MYGLKSYGLFGKSLPYEQLAMSESRDFIAFSVRPCFLFWHGDFNVAFPYTSGCR